jgi:outer membrane protein OmpA-like peptidoglycan-associated protein
VPTKPLLPAVILQTVPSKTVVSTNNVAELVTVIPNAQKTGYEVTGKDWSLAISSTTKFVQGKEGDTASRIAIEQGNTVTSNGTGFKPNSQVDIYVFSTPMWLGSTMSDSKGNFSVTLPMPAALPLGDHTFQASGKTPNNSVRTANVPITLVLKSGKVRSMTAEVYYAMDSYLLIAKERTTLAKANTLVKSKLTKTSKVTITITGWVQPTRVSPNAKQLSTNRAKAAAAYLKKLGLKGIYVLKSPGHDKDNIPSARHATVVISWTNSK